MLPLVTAFPSVATIALSCLSRLLVLHLVDPRVGGRDVAASARSLVIVRTDSGHTSYLSMRIGATALAQSANDWSGTCNRRYMTDDIDIDVQLPGQPLPLHYL